MGITEEIIEMYYTMIRRNMEDNKALRADIKKLKKMLKEFKKREKEMKKHGNE